MQRTQSLQSLVDDFGTTHFGISNTKAIRDGVCVSCKGSAVEFTDAISAKDYSITGMCQSCQDGMYS